MTLRSGGPTWAKSFAQALSATSLKKEFVYWAVPFLGVVALCGLCSDGVQNELLVILLLFVAYTCGTRSAGCSPGCSPGNRPSKDRPQSVQTPSTCASPPESSEAAAPPASRLCDEAVLKQLRSMKTAGRPDLALRLLHRVMRQGATPSAAAHAMTMGACNRGGEADAALGIFQLMRERGVEPDALSYQEAICAYGLKKDADNASAVFAEMQSKDFPRRSHGFAALVDAYHYCGLPQRCWEAYQDSREQGVLADSKLFKSVVDSLDDRLLREHGLELIEAMLAQGVHPTNNIQNRVIVAWKSKLPQRMTVVFDKLNRGGVMLSSTAYRCLMAAYERTDPARTLELHGEMVGRGLKLDRVAFNAVLLAMTQLGMLSRALELFEQMPQHGLAPNGKTYGLLIRACTLGKRESEAVDLFARMRAAEIEPNRFAYRDVVACLVRSRKLRQAVETYDEMRRSGVPPCDTTCLQLRKACAEGGWSERAAQIEAEFARLKAMESLAPKAAVEDTSE